jgi:hypothetical protein
MGDGMVASARSRDPRVTHLLLWVEGGYLDGLEIAWLDEYPDEFPPPSDVRRSRAGLGAEPHASRLDARLP